MLHSMMLGIQCYLCVLGSLLVPPKPDIIKVCDANRWYTYAWYDTDNVLILHAKNSEGGLPPRQSGVEYIDKLNLQTGKTEALPELNAFWNQHHSSFTDRSYITIDVRNERLLWIYHEFHNFGLGNVAYLFNFKSKQLRDAVDVWLYNPVVYLHPKHPEAIGLSYTREDGKPQQYTSYNFETQTATTRPLPKSLFDIKTALDYLGVKGDGRGVSVLYQESSVPDSPYEITLIDFGWKADAQVHRLPLTSQPPQYRFVEAYLSPNGKHILWLFTSKNDKKDTHCIWLSGSDGSNMREVTTLQSDLGRWGFFSFREFRWMPDSKSITYLFHDALYKLTVL